MFSLCLLSLALGAAVSLLFGKRGAQAGLTLGALGGALAIVTGLLAIYAGGFTLSVELGYGPGRAAFSLDGLSGFFVLTTGLALLPVSVYNLHQRVRGSRGTYAALYDLLALATLLVFASENAFAFLFFWEVAAGAFYALVAFEDGREGRVGAGYLYSAASKLGTAMILAAFFLAFAQAGTFGFPEMARSHLSGGYASAAFVLALVGFAVKAGVVPLQVWLPSSYSSAPPGAAALLAGGILNLGFYGIVRFDVQVLGPGPTWWGILVLLLGGISAAVGILYAIAQRDLSRFVAYSSVENAGIILIGLGIFMIGSSEKLYPLAALGVVVALLHMLHHSLAKSLLFLGVGAVDHATGTLQMDLLGGLARKMPKTALLSFVAVLSLAALPPSSGFATEWLTLESLMQGFRLSELSARAAMAIAGAFLALAGGVAILGFVKLYGGVFLGRGRSEATRKAKDPSVAGLVGMGTLALLGLSVGVLAPLWIRVVAKATASLTPAGDISGRMFSMWPVLQPAYENFSALSPTLLALALPALVVMVWGAVRIFGGREMVLGRVWTSGEASTGGVGYTPRGFSNALRTVFSDFYRPKEEVVGRLYRSRTLFWLEGSFYEWASGVLLGVTRRMKRIQSGNLSAYLLYVFVVLMLVLVYASAG